MSAYKICVYAICKNEAQFVDRWMDAVGEADLVVVTDTGSTDDTVEKLRRRGVLVYEEVINPWRFDEARNRSLAHVPDDVDICVSNDLDEVFDPGWRQALEAAWQPQHTRARYWFTWTPPTGDQPEKRFPMEKIHRRHDFHWVHPVHEVLAYSGGDPDASIFISEITLRHFPDHSKPRSQYLPLLELSAKENPQDDRTMFWLGREYMFNGRKEDAIRTLTRHLAMPSATWEEERSASMRFIARAWQAKGDLGACKRWLYRAIAECPEIREPYTELAQLGYETQDWPLSFWAVTQGLKIQTSTNSYLTEPASWGHSLPDLGAIACYWLGMYDRALTYADMALALSPEDERLQKNRALILAQQGGGEV